jgi:XTP/dITP diphosphohydrolase
MRSLNLETIVLATRNSGKAREFRDLLAPVGSQVLTLTDISLDVEFDETGNSFAENARLKVIGYSRLTLFPVLADDSGLEVEALGGRPGIHSARYAGPGASDADRVEKLLKDLGSSGGNRSARFVCFLALAQNGLVLLESAGTCPGLIANEPRGTNGFGYDPVFLFPELGKTFAELNEAEKNLHSHRARAVFSLLQQLRELSIVDC